MDLLRKTLTRRNALIGSTAGLGLAALGWWTRSASPMAAHPQAAVSGAPASTLAVADAPAAATTDAVEAPADTPAGAPAASATAVPASSLPVTPAGGAGLYDVDPDQSGVNQDPHVQVTSDVAALPLDMEF